MNESQLMMKINFNSGTPYSLIINFFIYKCKCYTRSANNPVTILEQRKVKAEAPCKYKLTWLLVSSLDGGLPFNGMLPICYITGTWFINNFTQGGYLAESLMAGRIRIAFSKILFFYLVWPEVCTKLIKACFLPNCGHTPCCYLPIVVKGSLTLSNSTLLFQRYTLLLKWQHVLSHKQARMVQTTAKAGEHITGKKSY